MEGSLTLLPFTSIIVNIDKCTAENREPGDPGCAPEQDIDYFYDGVQLMFHTIEERIDFQGTHG